MEPWFNTSKYPAIDLRVLTLPGPLLPPILINLLIALRHLLRPRTTLGNGESTGEKHRFADDTTAISLRHRPLYLQLLSICFGPLPMAALVGYASSCLGWRYVLFGVHARSPALPGDEAFIAMGVYWLTWIYLPLGMRHTIAPEAQNSAEDEERWFWRDANVVREEIRLAMGTAVFVMAVGMALYFGVKVCLGRF